ncbi:hypothetical protein K3495_g14484 [Podosphaera aphanis]|nr:hypothetical protein K3495_g14484 [Podosphaera aphanis]
MNIDDLSDQRKALTISKRGVSVSLQKETQAMPSSSKSSEKMKKSLISDMDAVHQQLSQVHDRLAGLEGNECPGTSNSGKGVIVKTPLRKVTQGIKPTQFPSFNGNRASYPGWWKFILNALKVAWNTFEYDDSQVFMMIYQSLQGTAYCQLVGFFGMRDGVQRTDSRNFLNCLIERITIQQEASGLRANSTTSSWVEATMDIILPNLGK